MCGGGGGGGGRGREGELHKCPEWDIDFIRDPTANGQRDQFEDYELHRSAYPLILI